MTKPILAALAAAFGIASATSALHAYDRDKLSGEITFGYESEYVFRGDQFDKQAFQPGIEMSYEDFYAGVWSSHGVDSDSPSDTTEIDFYAGHGFALNDLVAFDYGAIYYYYPEATSASQFELYGGLVFDTVLDPAAHLYYEFEDEIWTFEVTMGHDIDLTENTTLGFSASAGYQNFDDTASGDPEDALYGSAAIDLSYAFTDNASLSIGPRVSGKEYDEISSNSNLWWGASFTSSF
ncbi:MAG: TorF family putative porin [Opitutales bacterium]